MKGMEINKSTGQMTICTDRASQNTGTANKITDMHRDSNMLHETRGR